MRNSPADSANQPPQSSAWRNPYVWLVVALPVSSVLAGLALLVFALAQNDVQLPPGRAAESRRAIETLQPALRARNRAAEEASKP